ncbi:glucokinase, partial [Dyella silvatica]|uniref:glucokinase n=1 Tax=Dyella silvatica TaxID=2992128 RepID=UPI0022540395
MSEHILAGHQQEHDAFRAGQHSAGATAAMHALDHQSLDHQSWAFLAADVGGTHARIGLVAAQPKRGMPSILAYRSYQCAEYAGLDGIVHAFCEELAIKPRRLVLACAGYAHDGAIVNDNLPWPIVLAAVTDALALSELALLNDFEALAYATAYIDADGAQPLNAPARAAVGHAGPAVVVGPGTGLGAAVRLPSQPPFVLATEAGQIQLAARVGREQQVLGKLALPDTHVAY